MCSPSGKLARSSVGQPKVQLGTPDSWSVACTAASERRALSVKKIGYIKLFVNMAWKSERSKRFHEEECGKKCRWCEKTHFIFVKALTANLEVPERVAKRTVLLCLSARF